MMEIRTGLFVGLILVTLVTLTSADNEILGCGGFIKSHAEIDFSKIEIKL